MAAPEHGDVTGAGPAATSGVTVQRQRDLVDVTDAERVGTEPRALGELISQATQDLTTIMRKEVELAKVEIKQDVDNARRAGVLFGITGVLGSMALLLLSFAAAWGLSAIMPAGWAFAIVGAVYAIATAIVFLRARSAVKRVNAVPEQTIETLKEDVQWAKHPTS